MCLSHKCNWHLHYVIISSLNLTLDYITSLNRPILVNIGNLEHDQNDVKTKLGSSLKPTLEICYNILLCYFIPFSI